MGPKEWLESIKYNIDSVWKNPTSKDYLGWVDIPINRLLPDESICTLTIGFIHKGNGYYSRRRKTEGLIAVVYKYIPGENPPIRKVSMGGFSNEKEAANWILKRSKINGLLRNRLEETFSALEILALDTE